MIEWLLQDFANWWSPGETGYYVLSEGPLYDGGETTAYRGYKHLEKAIDVARRDFMNDPLADERTMDVLGALFDVIPPHWPRKRRLCLSLSIARYMAELD